MSKLAAIFIALSFLSLGHTKMHITKIQIDELVNKEWSEIKISSKLSKTSWNFRTSPPIPSNWPMKKIDKILIFAFAAGLDPEIKDGEVISEPWGRLEIQNSEKMDLKFYKFTKELKKLSVQGVHPLAPGENFDFISINWNEKLNEVAIKSYCEWFRSNSVISEKIIKGEANKFYKSLKCK